MLCLAFYLSLLCFFMDFEINAGYKITLLFFFFSFFLFRCFHQLEMFCYVFSFAVQKACESVFVLIFFKKKGVRVLERETKQNARNLTQEVSNCFLKNLVKLNFRPINSLFFFFLVCLFI